MIETLTTKSPLHNKHAVTEKDIKVTVVEFLIFCDEAAKSPILLLTSGCENNLLITALGNHHSPPAAALSTLSVKAGAEAGEAMGEATRNNLSLGQTPPLLSKWRR